MFTDDEEVIKAFVEELEGIEFELTEVFGQLEFDVNQPQLFETFGQVIDRVFGTAATMGHQELANYTRMLKEICYMCSQSDNLYARNQVRDLMNTALHQMKTFRECAHDKNKIKAIRIRLTQEMDKAKSLARTAFKGIQRKSVA